MKDNQHKTALLSGLLASTALSMIAAPAMAQDEEAMDDDTIVVTATRRETSVLDVPYNISAISGEEIQKAQIFDDAELLRSVPGVGVVDRGARNAGTINQVRIRGLSVDGNGLGDYAVSSVASVSTYVDETPVFANFLLRDLQRVEVLRGPQGTLYGSGSLGGTVRYITNAPKLGETEGYISGAASSVEGSDGIGYAADAMLNVPLGDKAALRIVGSYGDYPGVVDYVNVYELDDDGIPVAPNGILDPAASYTEVEDADTYEVAFGRISLLVEPTDNIAIKLLHARQSDDVGGRRQPTRGVDGFGDEYGEYENGSIQLEPSSRDVNMSSAEVNVDLGFATLTSSTSHYDHTGDSVSENTGFYAQAGFLGFYYNYPRPMASAVRTYADEAVVQELRLVSNGNETLDYVVGGFYRDQQLQSTQQSFLRGFKQYWDAFLPGLEAVVTGDKDFDYDRVENFEEMAVFGELTWHVTDRLDLTGGFRYFDNESENETFIDLPLYAGVFTPTTAEFSTSEDDVLFKANLAYEFGDNDLFYATISEGYRRGGSNAVPLSGTFAEDPGWQIYEADRVVNYETGIKGIAAGVTYDVSLFYIDWQDPQLNTATTNWGFFAVQNGSEARTKGVELILDGDLSETIGWNLGYAYTDAELTEDFFAPDNSTTPVALEGSRLPGAPEHMLNWAVDYNETFANGWSLYGRVDGSYQSETRNGVGVSPTFNVPIEEFSLWNGIVSATKGPITGSFWVKNIFNEEGVTGVFTEAYMGTAPAQGYFGNGNKEMISLPRTLGVTATYRF